MINEKMYGLGAEPSAIRELFAYGMARKAEIGEDKVFDFSIGNPSVPAPEKVAQTMHELADWLLQSSMLTLLLWGWNQLAKQLQTI